MVSTAIARIVVWRLFSKIPSRFCATAVVIRCVLFIFGHRIVRGGFAAGNDVRQREHTENQRRSPGRRYRTGWKGTGSVDGDTAADVTGSADVADAADANAVGRTRREETYGHAADRHPYDRRTVSFCQCGLRLRPAVRDRARAADGPQRPRKSILVDWKVCCRAYFLTCKTISGTVRWLKKNCVPSIVVSLTLPRERGDTMSFTNFIPSRTEYSFKPVKIKIFICVTH